MDENVEKSEKGGISAEERANLERALDALEEGMNAFDV